MSRQTNAEDEAQFLKELAKVGGSVGNKALRDSLEWGEAHYSHVRQRLIDKGLVKIMRGGPGGSVYLLDSGSKDKHAQVVATKNEGAEVEWGHLSDAIENTEKPHPEDGTTDFTPAVLGDTNAVAMNIQSFMDQYDGGVYYVPNYQRDSSQWDESKRSLFIESLINNITIPPLFVYPDAPNKNEIVDGQQRVSTIRDFFANKLTLVSEDDAEYRDNVGPIIQGKKYKRPSRKDTNSNQEVSSNNYQTPGTT